MFINHVNELQFVVHLPHRIGGWWQTGEEIDLIIVGQGMAMVLVCNK